MIAKSLRYRLLGAASIVILIALQVAGAALLVLFERNVIRHVDLDLNAYIEQLAANVARTADGGIEMPIELADPRFRQPLAGRYWQMSTGATSKLHSRSLWDFDLAVAFPEPRQGVRYMRIPGPDRQILYAAVRSILLEPDSPGQAELRIGLITAMDAAEIETLKNQFLGDMLTALGLLAALLISAAWVQVSVGLLPFEQLRIALANIRLGNAKRLAGNVPREIEPLVAETNRLLDAQDKAIDKARARAGDLAHGLKTPLTALTIVAQQLRAEGRCDLGQEMEHHLKGLTSHVERELVRARMAAGSSVGHRTPVAPILSRLVRTMQTLPRGDDIEWDIDCAADLRTSLDEIDLIEALGNLLDNARKWSKAEVRIEGSFAGDHIEIAVTDDGPGVPAAEYERVLRRGIRLDETKPGSGLGLSIVREIAETYGGSVELSGGANAGLTVRLRLPMVRASA